LLIEKGKSHVSEILPFSTVDDRKRLSKNHVEPVESPIYLVLTFETVQGNVVAAGQKDYIHIFTNLQRWASAI
jgi:hypothetical protein